MSNKAKFRADYEGLEQIARKFEQQAEAQQRELATLQKCKNQLQQGDWIGAGATAFYAEMDSSILPAMKRLVAALRQAAKVTATINQLVQQAEKEAASVLTYNGQTSDRPSQTQRANPSAGSSKKNNELIPQGLRKPAEWLNNSLTAAGTGANIRALREWAKRLKTLKPLLEYFNVISPYVLRPIRELEELYKIEKAAVNALDALPAPWRKMAALFDSLPVKSLGIGLNALGLAGNIEDAYRNIKGGNYLDLVENGADAFMSGADIVATFTGNPVLAALAGGYAAGKILDNFTGASDAISDVLAGNHDKWSGRDYVDDFVQNHASSEERKTYFDWRREWRGRVIAAEKGGATSPPYNPPPLEVFRKLDPWVKARAHNGESFTKESLAHEQYKQKMGRVLPGGNTYLLENSPIL